MASERPLNLIEKIILHHSVGLSRPTLAPGEAVCVRVDWTMANELTLVGITDMWSKIGRPPVFDKERVWLALDHTIDPRNVSEPKPKALIKLADDFLAETQITDFWGPNTTIMHTEFARQRAQPGQIVIGADSHTCSAGGMGALAIGLGAGDVTLPLVTGHTWLQVPEVCLIEFVGEPRFGVGGKDIILHVLGVLKRNTVANERAVEWAGPGLRFMSADARFAIANMTTEFGGIAGVFEADEQTARALAGRKAGQGDNHRAEALYFRADAGAEYAFRHTIDLAAVEPQVALFPSPDNCRAVSALAPLPPPAPGAPSGEAGAGMPPLDGCFIGACTTTQEDLILGALVLEAGLKAGLVPKPGAKRRVTPGSLQIIKYLREHGVLDVYERAGFVVGAPGCSYCLGIAADVAGDQEVWLSSQNRNFKNRMGKGSLANLASAAVVAASSYSMTLTDPAPLLAKVDR
jgi:homoaconitate hydratase